MVAGAVAPQTGPMTSRVALIAGATRGAGRAIAVELARAGFRVVATGRSSRTAGPSDQGKPEVVEHTAELAVAAGGRCEARVVDHTDSAQVAALVEHVGSAYGRLDVLVNDMFGGDAHAQWGVPLWEHDLEAGRLMLRLGVESHLVTLHHAVPLMLETAATHRTHALVLEVTDGHAGANREPRPGAVYYDLVKAQVQRVVELLGRDCADLPLTALGVTPGWLRSESMLRGFGVTEATWTDATRDVPAFGISESPTYVARGVAALARDADIHRWNARVVTARELADVYGVSDTDGSRPDCWGLWAVHGWESDTPEAVADIARFR